MKPGTLLLVPNTLDLGTAHAPPLEMLLGAQVMLSAQCTCCLPCVVEAL